MKTFGITDYTNLVPLKCCGQTDGRTAGGRSGPTTRTAFAKATQVKKTCHIFLWHGLSPEMHHYFF